MNCTECTRLKLEYQLATAAYDDIIQMQEKDTQSDPTKEPPVWDFILAVAVRAREDAQRALEGHRAKHKSFTARAVSIILLSLFEKDLWGFSDVLTAF